MMQELNEEEEYENDEEEEVIFVLTDEWKEFFAKSEAKRRLGNFYYSRVIVPDSRPQIYYYLFIHVGIIKLKCVLTVCSKEAS